MARLYVDFSVSKPMRTITEDEARALMRDPLKCEDIGEWLPLKVQPGTVSVGVGVLDEFGASAQMYVELVYRRSHKTTVTRYVFTLFQRFPYGKERVYQLEVTHAPSAYLILTSCRMSTWAHSGRLGMRVGRVGDMMKYWHIFVLRQISHLSRRQFIQKRLS
ncbi:hypothetical protein D3872_24565 [Massilia cavernae]|uniref:Uncharacterized protein n=1 Tax=Massilia cavernae TaxID=2320864 RepID=A0A418X779_9BURK|nr:hypothetical protein D3872_24565 [Massilia cavernae]